MSKIEPIDLLARARENEKKYDWIAAVEMHEKALGHSLQQEDLLRAGEVAERIGYCFQRTAMQAKSRAEFEKKMKLAIKAYQRAQGFYGSLRDKQKGGREFRSRAVAVYLCYWLSSKGVEKRKLLDECLELENKALTQFERDGNMLEYCRTYNALWPVFYLRGFLEWNGNALLRLVRRGREWGERAVSALSETDYPSEVAWAYFVFSTCLSFIASLHAIGVSIIDTEETEKNSLKVMTSLEKAFTVSKKLDDSFLTGLLHLWSGYQMGRTTGSRSYYEKALDLGVTTRDNFLTGISLELLANSMLWQGLGNPTQWLKSMEAAKELYDRSQQHNSITQLLSPTGGEIAAPNGYATYYREKAIGWGSDPNKRLDLLKIAEKAAIEAMEEARTSDMPRAIGFSSHCLSVIRAELAKLELDPRKKKNLLRKAIAHRELFIKTLGQAERFRYSGLGVGWNYLAECKAQLAELESDPRVKEMLLKEAVTHSEKSLELFGKLIPHAEQTGDFEHVPILGRMIERFETTLTKLHDLTRQSDILRRTIVLLNSSIKLAKKQGIVGTEAISYWKIAMAQNTLEDYLEASESFKQAAESYLGAAKRFPQLKDLQASYGSYMQAWCEIEKAKEAHAKKLYGEAKNSYEKAAGLHESTTRWSYLGPNYSALAKLEAAEELSRNEKTQEAKEAFLEAFKLFEKARESFEAKCDAPFGTKEKELADALSIASEKRRSYCLGRILLEEARIQDRKGDHLESSRKYGFAAKVFESLAKDGDERSRQQLLPIFYLCKAWARMMMAEETASSAAYEEAAELFNQAKENSLDRENRLLALANCSFCRALASGTEFENTRDKKVYSNAKKHMEAAENYYLKANQEPSSEYAKATLTLMDGYMYATKAETETEPSEKAKYYEMAEKALNFSSLSYLRAKHPDKSAEVQKLIESIVEKHQLAVSLASVLQEPAITATTKSFSVPTPTHEEAVGFERFEHAELEANLAISGEAVANEQIEVKLDMVNVGKQTALLLRVQDMVPSGFEITSLSSQSENEGNSINMKGTRIEPLGICTIQLLMQTPESGIFNLKPQINYVDDIGNFKQCFAKPVTLIVHPKLELVFRTDAARKVFEYLTRSFVEDYMRRKVALQKSGWRSLVQVMKNARVSSRSVYGRKRIPGPAISELERRGLIEKRVFLGERGRGGKVFKARVCYEKDIVKRLVDHNVAKKE